MTSHLSFLGAARAIDIYTAVAVTAFWLRNEIQPPNNKEK